VGNSRGKIKRTRAAAAATRSLATAAAFGDIILYGGAGNFPNVEHLFVRSFMTRAARGGYWRGPVDRRRLVAVVVRVAVVVLPLFGRARTHSHTYTRARTRPHHYGTTYTGARANRRAHAQRRRWPARRTGRVRRAGRRRRPRPRDRRLVPSAATANRRARRSRVFRGRQRSLATDRVFTYYFTSRRVHASLLIINNFLHKVYNK